MAFVAFLEPGARHAHTTRITEILHLALHLKESGSLRLVHFRSSGIGAFVFILRPHLVVAGATAQFHILEALFINGLTDDRAFIAIHQCLNIRQRCILVLVLLIFTVVLGVDKRSRHIHLYALLMGQGMLEVKVECRRIAGCVVIDV